MDHTVDISYVDIRPKIRHVRFWTLSQIFREPENRCDHKSHTSCTHIDRAFIMQEEAARVRLEERRRKGALFLHKKRKPKTIGRKVVVSKAAAGHKAESGRL